VPKATVYIPDDMWEKVRIRASQEGTNVSQVIQSALKQALSMEAPIPPFALSRPTIPEPVAARLRERLEREARELYEAGFESGLRLADLLSWGQLDRLAAVEWEFRRWSGDDILELLMKFDQSEMGLSYSDYFDLVTSGVSLVETPAFRRGKLDALRSVWASVAVGSQPS
jgi:hypothetical protein